VEKEMISKILLVLVVLVASCSMPQKSQRYLASDGSFQKLPQFSCERGVLLEGEVERERFSGNGECGMFASGLNSGDKFYCVGRALYEGLEEKRVYNGWPICQDYSEDLNSSRRYRCEDGDLYEGLKKIKTFAGGGTECEFTIREMNSK
jgi:hypothetical protein